MITKFLRFCGKLVGWFFLLTILWVLIYKWIPVPLTPLMVIRDFENPQEDIRHDWVPITSISKNLQRAVVASEDQNFLLHNGFDVEAIRKVLHERSQEVPLRGASTISQQTAKNVFLWPNRSWVRKGLEAYFTVLMELLWSKERILEVYLNSIEMGKGVYGAEAATKFWFGINASEASGYQAAALAAILPNPRVYKPTPATSYIESRIQWILRQMRNLGTWNFEE